MHSLLTLLFSSLVLPFSCGATKTPFDDNVRSHPYQFGNYKPVPDEYRLTPVGIYDNSSFGNLLVSQPGIDNETFNGMMPHRKFNLICRK